MKVAVVGATGAVGTRLLSILEERRFPATEIVPYASKRSLGKEVQCLGKSYTCRVLENGCFDGVDMVFFDASDAVSREWVPQAADAGAWVIDNSATFRLEQDIPLLIPEVNGDLVKGRMARKTAREGIFAGPNCSTVQMVMVLKPILNHFGLKRVVVSTYQSTSGAGAAAQEELMLQLESSLSGTPSKSEIFPHPIAFNCIPHIGGFKEDGYTSEEQKMMAETKKILDLPGLKITATAVRVPTLICHAESINVECEKSVDVAEARKILSAFHGIEVVDDPSKNVYPLAMQCGGRDPVYVGRIRRDASVENGLNLWIVSDNLRKGAALNAVQIGELILRARAK